MRYIIHQRNGGEDELILNYKQLNPEVEAVFDFMEKNQQRLSGRKNGETILFSPEEILYVDKVDDKTFSYTAENELQLDLSLYSVELMLNDERYFRCSKSMIVNVSKVKRLKSMPSNMIDATLENGVHIIISRTYASEFRRLLKGERV